jgi:hypothetical protein
MHRVDFSQLQQNLSLLFSGNHCSLLGWSGGGYAALVARRMVDMPTL